MSLNFSAQNLENKSFKGQNLQGANFSKANLRGADFENANLLSANFSHADIQGVSFTNSKLNSANFSYAKTGLKKSWEKFLFISYLFLAFIAGLGAGLAGSWITNLLTSDNSLLKFSVNGNVVSYSPVAGVLSLVVLAVFFTVTIYQGLPAAFRIGSITAIVAGIITASVIAFRQIALGSPGGESSVGVAGSAASAVVLGITPVLILAFVFTITESWQLPTAAAIIGYILAGAIQFYPYLSFYQFIGTLIFPVFLGMLSFYIRKHILLRDERYIVIQKIAVVFAAFGGTNFSKADLTEADFTQAKLRYANLRNAILTHTNFYTAKQLHQTRVGGTILFDSVVQNLLVTHKLAKKSYIGKNFRGANLAGADLSYIDLTEADISEATFVSANLEYANLTKTQALKTNFQQTRLTGACLEAWNIDSTTELSGAICEYVYLLNNQRERRPSSGIFQTGEFTKLFQEVLDTVDLIFRNGVDWKAFTYSFNQLQIENEGAELSIRSIENKGDGVVVVRVDVPEDADKSKIYSEFTQVYDTTVKILEEKYRGEIESKDKQIDIYRQHLADLQKILQLFEKQPINIYNKSKVVILKFGEGNFHTGFPVTLQIGEERKSISLECAAKLPAYPEIIESYNYWQSAYRQALNAVCTPNANY